MPETQTPRPSRIETISESLAKSFSIGGFDALARRHLCADAVEQRASKQNVMVMASRAACATGEHRQGVVMILACSNVRSTRSNRK